MSDSQHLFSRVVGAMIGGGGGFAAMHFGALGLTQPVMIAIVAGLAIAGFAFGAKVWEAVVNLL